MTPQLVLAWTCVAIFIATAVVTLLALVGLVKLGGGAGDNHQYYLKKLFLCLVVEVVGIAVFSFRETVLGDKEAIASLQKQLKSQDSVYSIAPVKLSSDTTSVKANRDSVAEARPANPTFKITRDTLKVSGYATTDNPKRQTRIIEIPKGFYYVGHKTRETTKNGSASKSVSLVKEKDKVVAVKMTLKVADRKFLGARNWIGAVLIVYVEKKTASPAVVGNHGLMHN